MDVIHSRVDDESFRSIDSLLLRRLPKRRPPTAAATRKCQLEKAFLQPQKGLSVKLIQRTQQRWDLAVDKSLLFEIDPPDVGTQTLLYRGGRNFHIVGYEEVPAPRELNGEAQNVAFDSLTASSLLARVGQADEAAVDAEEEWLQKSILAKEQAVSDASSLQKIIRSGTSGLLEVAPGLQRGIRFSKERLKFKPKSGRVLVNPSLTTEAVQKDLELSFEERKQTVNNTKRYNRGDDENSANDEAGGHSDGDSKTDQFDDDVDELLPVEFPSLQSCQALGAVVNKRSRREWAHMVDLNAESCNFRSLIPGEMARDWPFELDAFQKEAIYHLECGDSVFVAAHTSAGKTVVAEYAIALAQKHQTKAIYTSPIKALSNQKFRDFKNTFEDVGILTGDVQINQEAKCLIMTTEILRSKLYSQSDLLREVEFVIFDEVHYVSDSERGVVWEEVIIMLPEQVSLILLSATVPNTYEFASWVGRTKKRDVYVISTPKRPVPLEHYLWSGKTVQKIVSADRKWNEKGYREAKMIASGEAALSSATHASGGKTAVGVNRGSSSGGRSVPIRGRGGGRGGSRGGANGPPRASHNAGHMGRGGRATGGSSIAQEKTLWSDVVRYLRKSSLLPACIFVFSRMRCEEYAMSLSNLDFCDAGEKTRIHFIYSKSITRLTKEDQELPQITRLRDMATRGIAVHHGGLLPIVKEIVELLFAQSLVKVLFATETFAVGLNLPTRTVVFSDHRKFDGIRRRILSPGEYTQMAGRAGRRGLDSVGTAIIVPMSENKDVPPAEILRGLILGQPTRLTSQFRLTYNMILSLHRVETLKVEDMMKRSFSEHATQNDRSEQEEKIRALEKDLAKLIHVRSHCEACSNTMGACHLAAETYRQDTVQMYAKLFKTPAIGPALFTQGRLINFVNEQGVHAIGVIAEDPFKSATNSGTPPLSVIEIRPPRSSPDETDSISFVPALRIFWQTAIPSKLRLQEVKVPLTKIEHLSSQVLFTSRQLSDLSFVENKLHSLDLSWGSDIWDEASLDKDRDIDVVWYADDRQAKANAVAASPALACPDFIKHYALRHDEWLVRDELAQMRRTVDDSNLALLPEYQNRITVLKHLGFVNDNSVVMLKGRVACEVRTADELVLTEVILNNILAGLDPTEIAALLSVFVYQGKDDSEIETAPFISNGLTKALAEVYRIWKEVIRTQEQFHVISAGDESERSSKLHFGLMEVVYEWASGSPFKNIAIMTTEQEGTIVRTITRLEETSREVRNIGRIIGDTTLETKMNGVKEAIMRNITTVPSLYL